uniref:Cell cycle checkpoint control protein RAD9A n=1 Tax=Sparus aurata TaxID=8175 RepID=A0A671V6N0_SPAAU
MLCICVCVYRPVLAKAIHSLSRIGDELYVEPQDDGLALRSVNSSRSAYACFLFAPLFFSRYTIPSGHAFRCKMAIKSVQAVFRSLASLEKTVEKCHIGLDEKKNRLTFTLHCKHGLLKTHNLSFQDSESLQAVFDKDSYGNVFRSHPRLLVDTVVHFPPSLEEVTGKIIGGLVRREWIGKMSREGGKSFEGLCINLHIKGDLLTDFSSSLLQGMLVFAESTGLPVSMYFDEPGSPLVLSVTDSVLEGNFVLATLSDDSNHRKNNSRREQTPPPPPNDDFMDDDMDSYLIAMDTSIAPGPSATRPPTPPLAVSTYSKQPAAANHRSRLIAEEQEEEEEEEAELADSAGPPNKKVWFSFHMN